MEKEYKDKTLKALQEYIKKNNDVNSLEELKNNHVIIVIGEENVNIQRIQAEMQLAELPIILIKGDKIIGVKDEKKEMPNMSTMKSLAISIEKETRMLQPYFPMSEKIEQKLKKRDQQNIDKLRRKNKRKRK